MKNILLINSNPSPSKLIVSLFKEAEKQDCFFHVLSSSPDFLDWFNETSSTRVVKKIKSGPRLEKKKGVFLIILILPLICLKQFITLIYLKKFKQVSQIICFNDSDKLIFTSVAKVLRLKVFWFERPENNNLNRGKFLLKLLKSLSNYVNKTIVLTEETKNNLIKQGFKEEKIKNIYLGISPTQEHQDNLFSTLARKGEYNSFQGCFSIGVITDLDSIHQIESLFLSIKICLNIFTNLRVVIIGDGREKKRLAWLAKQAGVQHLIYLVGDQKDLEKWWDSFDVYLAWTNQAKIHDFQVVLEAMLAKVPILAFEDKGWQDLVLNNKTGFLIPEGDSEALAHKFIQLYQNPQFRKKLGQNASELVKTKFTFSRQVQRLAQEL